MNAIFIDTGLIIVKIKKKTILAKQLIENLNKDGGRNGNSYLKGKKDHKFARAIKKYGWDSFNHSVLLVFKCNTKEEIQFWADKWEKYYIEKYDSYYNGYNSTLGGQG